MRLTTFEQFESKHKAVPVSRLKSGQQYFVFQSMGGGDAGVVGKVTFLKAEPLKKNAVGFTHRFTYKDSAMEHTHPFRSGNKHFYQKR